MSVEKAVGNKTRALWTKAKRDLFLAELAQTANVSASARKAKMKEPQAYAERRKSIAFREAWAEALSEGYAKLELMMLGRAMKALGAKPDEANAAATKLEEYSNKLAMTLLTAHRAAARDGRGQRSESGVGLNHMVDVKSRLSAKFDSMHERLTAETNDAAAQ
jgi:hypothetical protein